MQLEEWFAGGERVTARASSAERASASQAFQLFCRVEGAGPWLTFLHGFPTCSWDWAKIADPLEAKYRLLMFDFLGFGDSDKPSGHRYSLLEQADLTESLWRHFGIEKTGLVAHDYGATVALELLSRQAEGRLATRIERVVLMNAGLYVDLQRPLLAQRLLQKPAVGELLSRLIGERMFNNQFSSIFSKAHPVSDSDLRQHWRMIERRGGHRNYHRLIYYLRERQRYKSRWEKTLESSLVPIRFVWGLEDPVSGRHMSDHIRKRIPNANLLELSDVGHYPQLEVSALIAAEIVNAFM